MNTNCINKDNVVEQLLTDELIIQSYIYSDKSQKYWKIQKPITVTLSNGKIINIEKGFTYDMSTVPKWLWSFVRPCNDALLAYLIHDKLYSIQDPSMTRKQVDQEMLYWSNIINDNKFDNKLRYYIVRLLGWIWWNRI